MLSCILWSDSKMFKCHSRISYCANGPNILQILHSKYARKMLIPD